MTNSKLFLICSRFSRSGCVTLTALALRSAASSAILRVYASASTARSRAFLNRAVAISSIVRVILRMLRIARRRCTNARVFAMWTRSRLRLGGGGRRFELRLERVNGGVQFFEHRLPLGVFLPGFHVRDQLADFRLLFVYEAQELGFPLGDLTPVNLVQEAPRAGIDNHHLVEHVHGAVLRLLEDFHHAV